MTSDELFDLLLRASKSGVAAMRAVTKLQPIDGEGGRVFPSTYEKGAYAFEERIRDGAKIQCVLLDSVQSQVNRFEEALLEAWRSGRLDLPVFEITIPGHESINSLTVPHRVHDAILRDSLWAGEPFRDSENGKRLVAARAWDATPFFEYAPTVLLFGTWDSQSGGGVNTAKVARSLVSEIVAFDVVEGKKTSSRMDPLSIKALENVIYRSKATYWTIDPTLADKEKGKPVLMGKKHTGKPSDINHGNVTPTIGPGGVTFKNAEQTTVLSFTQLRKLRFPEKSDSNADRDAAGRAVIAALGLYAVALQWEDGFQLRSRCQLIPVEDPKFEVIGRTAGDRTSIAFDIAAAEAAVQTALENAANQGLKWHAGRIELTPKPDLVKLVQYSDQSVEVEGEK